jgi:hypothetical protein
LIQGLFDAARARVPFERIAAEPVAQRHWYDAAHVALVSLSSSFKSREGARGACDG